jgi:hypothetical protein
MKTIGKLFLCHLVWVSLLMCGCTLQVRVESKKVAAPSVCKCAQGEFCTCGPSCNCDSNYWDNKTEIKR